MAPYDYTTQRLFVDQDLRSGHCVKMERAQANYLLNVLRLKAGSVILLFNGRDGEWRGEIVPLGRKNCEVRVLGQTREQPQQYTLTYIFAPLKKARMEYMVQKAVEMGAGILQPVVTEHTQITKVNLERMRAYVIEASEQCGILTLAQVNEPLKLEQLLMDHCADTTIVFCDEATDKRNALDTLKSLKGNRLALLIGPEGGFSLAERERLRALDFVQAISLGPRILRADTAGVAALALLQAAAGDW